MLCPYDPLAKLSSYNIVPLELRIYEAPFQLSTDKLGYLDLLGNILDLFHPPNDNKERSGCQESITMKLKLGHYPHSPSMAFLDK